MTKGKFLSNTYSIQIPFNVIKTIYASNSLLYIGVSISVFVIFWIIFNVFDQLLFFSPILYFYMPSDAVTGFIITNISAGILGIIVSLNINFLKHYNFHTEKLLLSGSILGIFFSTCTNCSSVGLFSFPHLSERE